MTLNSVLKALRAALRLQEEDIRALAKAGGADVSRSAVNGWLRQPDDSAHYRRMRDSELSAVLRGLAQTYNPGYSPENLRRVISPWGDTQAERIAACASKLGVSPRAVQGWLAPSTAKSHRTMPYRLWQKVLLP
jgi:hypothetical protein